MRTGVRIWKCGDVSARVIVGLFKIITGINIIRCIGLIVNNRVIVRVNQLFMVLRLVIRILQQCKNCPISPKSSHTTHPRLITPVLLSPQSSYRPSSRSYGSRGTITPSGCVISRQSRCMHVSERANSHVPRVVLRCQAKTAVLTALMTAEEPAVAPVAANAWNHNHPNCPNIPVKARSSPNNSKPFAG